MSLNRGGSYMDSREWVKNQKDTINPKNKNDNMYFKYTVTVALNHEKIKKTAKNVKDWSLHRPIESEINFSSHLKTGKKVWNK